MVDKELVYEIVRSHFQIKDNKKRLNNYSKYIIEYFTENCSIMDIHHMTIYEHSNDGLYELLKYLSEHLLKKFGYESLDYVSSTWSKYGRIWRYHKSIDSLLDPERDVYLMFNSDFNWTTYRMNWGNINLY